MGYIKDDEEDFELLKLANEKGKFAITLDGAGPLQKAFERGIDNEWFTFVDVGPIHALPGMFKIFRLTEKGHTRLKELQEVNFEKGIKCDTIDNG